jgi:hypothetical protein
LSLTERKYYIGGRLIGGKPFGGKQALGLDHFDGDEAPEAGIVAGGAEEIGFRLVDDPFTDGVLMNMGDLVHEEAELIVLDPEGAAAVLPEMVFLQAPEGLAIFFKALEHPIAAEVHFHFNGLQQCGGGIFLKVPLEIGGRSSVPCADNEVEVVGHEAPGVKVHPLSMDKVVQGVGNHLFVGRPDKQIYLIYYVECQEKTGVKRKVRFFI